MTEIIHSLFHLVDEWTDQQYINDPEFKKLSDQQGALQDEIIRRLGEGGQEMMETLVDLNLKLENLHEEALFRAAMQLGAQIAQPAAQRADNVRPYSTSR